VVSKTEVGKCWLTDQQYLVDGWMDGWMDGWIGVKTGLIVVQ
jgi:hypothetical protein